jgi:hypothetical protein
MNKLSDMLTVLISLRGNMARLSVNERAAIGCAIQILNDVERLGVTVDTLSKDFYYATHQRKAKSP